MSQFKEPKSSSSFSKGWSWWGVLNITRLEDRRYHYNHANVWESPPRMIWSPLAMNASKDDAPAGMCLASSQEVNHCGSSWADWLFRRRKTPQGMKPSEPVSNKVILEAECCREQRRPYLPLVSLFCPSLYSFVQWKTIRARRPWAAAGR